MGTTERRKSRVDGERRREGRGRGSEGGGGLKRQGRCLDMM